MAMPTFTRAASRYNLLKLHGRHLEVHRRLSVGQPLVQIMRELGMSRSTVNYTRDCDLGQARMGELQGERDKKAIDVQREIAEFAPLALEGMVALAVDPNSSQRTKFDTNRWFLETAGFSPTHKSESTVAHLSRDDIAKMRDDAAGANPIDVTPADVTPADVTLVEGEKSGGANGSAVSGSGGDD
ncbi:hypothetical protein LCGC14_0993350 [marine sediment metagenome]|uniref:Uncharacterized protein n=1 Tax=marine sediment metagenome TaxID=412755 RepID=A0A0F9QNJ8_9ZZZZ